MIERSNPDNENPCNTINVAELRLFSLFAKSDKYRDDGERGTSGPQAQTRFARVTPIWIEPSHSNLKWLDSNPRHSNSQRRELI